MDINGDLRETNINYWHDSAKNEYCVLYTTKKSVMESCIKRNKPHKVEGDQWGWNLYYTRDQVRSPMTWIKVASANDETKNEEEST